MGFCGKYHWLSPVCFVHPCFFCYLFWCWCFRYIEIFKSSLNEASACIGYGPKPRSLLAQGMGMRPGPYNRNQGMGGSMGPSNHGYGRGRGGRNLKGRYWQWLVIVDSYIDLMLIHCGFSLLNFLKSAKSTVNYVYLN